MDRSTFSLLSLSDALLWREVLTYKDIAPFIASTMDCLSTFEGTIGVEKLVVGNTMGLFLVETRASHFLEPHHAKAAT
jgi:hypothetical protein